MATPDTLYETLSVDQLNGDFSICIYDYFNEIVYLFRDHLGIRPLAYHNTGDSLVFSTDLMSLCRSILGHEGVSQEYLLMLYKEVDQGVTPHPGVSRLAPGHYLKFSKEGLRKVRYWHPEKIKIDKSIQFADLLSNLNTLVDDAVSIRSDSRFTAGTHASGGLDSGIVSVLARKSYQHQDPFYGFSWSPEKGNAEKAKYDERTLVTETCEMAGITPVFSDLDESTFRNLVTNYFENHGYYYEDHILDLASQRNVNLIFSGFGGDEFVSKADSGILSDLFFGLHWKTYFRRLSHSGLKRFIKQTLFSVVFPALGVLNPSSRKMYDQMGRYLKEPFKKFNRHILRDRHFYKSRRKIHLSIYDSQYLPQRTEIWTVRGFYKGIEYRFPLLDKRIVEYMIKAPSLALAKTEFSRMVIREISNGILPESVRWRTDGTDPVLFRQNDDFIKDYAILCFSELDEWKSCSGLQFIDFETLGRDIERYKANPDSITGKSFFYSIALIKAFRLFIEKYKKDS